VLFINSKFFIYLIFANFQKGSGTLLKIMKIAGRPLSVPGRTHEELGGGGPSQQQKRVLRRLLAVKNSNTNFYFYFF
jgi:hypothetical protein